MVLCEERVEASGSNTPEIPHIQCFVFVERLSVLGLICFSCGYAASSWGLVWAKGGNCAGFLWVLGRLDGLGPVWVMGS